MESVIAKVVAEGVVEAIKFGIAKRRGVEVIVPQFYRQPIRPGSYPTNREANTEGFPVLVKNYSNHEAVISFFQFISKQKISARPEVYEYPIRFNLAQHHILESKRTAQFALPWKAIESASALARFRRTSHPHAGFRFELTAFDEFRNEFYHSGPLNEYAIRTDASHMLGEF